MSGKDGDLITYGVDSDPINIVNKYDSTANIIRYALKHEVKSSEEYVPYIKVLDAAFDSITHKIAEAMAREFPDKNRYKTPRLKPALLLYVPEPSEEEYAPAYYLIETHSVTIPVFKNELLSKVSTIHEAIHSACRTMLYRRFQIDEETMERKADLIADISGLYVRAVKKNKFFGISLMEGLTEYLTLQYILNDSHPEAKKMKAEIISKAELTTKILFFNQPDKDTATIEHFYNSHMPIAYKLSYKIVRHIFTSHPELNDLFLCSLASPTAKARLAKELRKLYGFELTRELFRANIIELVDPEKQKLRTQEATALLHDLKVKDGKIVEKVTPTTSETKFSSRFTLLWQNVRDRFSRKTS